MHRHFGEWVFFFRLSPKNVCVLGTKGLTTRELWIQQTIGVVVDE